MTKIPTPTAGISFQSDMVYRRTSCCRQSDSGALHDANISHNESRFCRPLLPSLCCQRQRQLDGGEAIEFSINYLGCYADGYDGMDSVYTDLTELALLIHGTTSMYTEMVPEVRHVHAMTMAAVLLTQTTL